MADGVSIHIDPDDLTLGELEDFEDLVGRPLDEVLADAGKDGKPRISAKVLKAFVLIAGRRTNPDMTEADARAVRVSQLELGTKPDPTGSAGTPD